MRAVDPVALFRLSVVEPSVSGGRLKHSELRRIIRALALTEYALPGSRRCLIGEKTIETRNYAFRRGGIEDRVRLPRNDLGVPNSNSRRNISTELKNGNARNDLGVPNSNSRLPWPAIRHLQAAGVAEQAAPTRTPILPLVKALAPISLGPALL